MRVAIAMLCAAPILVATASFGAMTKEARTAFVASCTRQMFMSTGECACMADVADKTLDAAAVTYLSLDARDVRHSAGMAKSMTAAEVRSIDHFMQTAPHTCKGAT